MTVNATSRSCELSPIFRGAKNPGHPDVILTFGRVEEGRWTGPFDEKLLRGRQNCTVGSFRQAGGLTIYAVKQQKLIGVERANEDRFAGVQSECGGLSRTIVDRQSRLRIAIATPQGDDRSIMRMTVLLQIAEGRQAGTMSRPNPTQRCQRDCE